MRLEGPDSYKLEFDATSFSVGGPDGGTRFIGRATSKLPKLYVISSRRRPVYVGVTRQSMRSRLRIGWNATGETGYHGYEWRHHLKSAQLDIWYHLNPPTKNISLEIETVEAEVVYLIRKHGQWPRYQTEIHFHESKAAHRRLAERVLSSYRAP